MKFRLSELWRWDGTVDRGPYALIGVVGFAIKHNLDRLVATAVFHRKWSLFNYWIPPTKAVRITELSRDDAALLATLLALALPFIWVGVALTLRRLRAIDLPAWLVAFFFLPVLNLLFFIIMGLLPSRKEAGRQRPLTDERSRTIFDRVIPDHPVGSAAIAILLTALVGIAATALGTTVFTRYGWGLFVALPFCMGLGSVLIYGYHRPRSYPMCVGVSLISLLLIGGALLSVAIEGVVCLAMALPLAVPLAVMGGSLGYVIQRRPWTLHEAPSMMLVVVLFVPGLMGVERASKPEPPVFAVLTAIDIDAPPEKVWPRVVAFTELPEPTEWLFRAGIAYPTKAKIYCRGAGATRQCKFSTGTFVEPIEIWNEPRLLKFSVTSNPPPMQEWTPYSEIHPPHLAGFLVSREGQFLLTPLPNGGTRLEGTTWYQHNMWPATYWKIWSDTIIHQIHRRVLAHIKRLAERQVPFEAER